MKIKIKSKGIPTTHFGYLWPDTEEEVSEQFARYCVEVMRAAEYVQAPAKKRGRPRKTVTSTEVK